MPPIRTTDNVASEAGLKLPLRKSDNSLASDELPTHEQADGASWAQFKGLDTVLLTGVEAPTLATLELTGAA